MADHSHIALIALRMAPGKDTAEPQAIVIGTMPKTGPWNEGDWRYAGYTLSDLETILREGVDPLVQAGIANSLAARAVFATAAEVTQAVTDNKPHGRLSQSEFDILIDKVKDSDGNSTTRPDADAKTFFDARKFQVFPLRDIERVYFYSHDGGDFSVAEKRLTNPFAAFDVARVIDDDGGSDVLGFGAIQPEQGDDRGSHVILVPDFAKPPGALAAIAIHLEIKTAVNGHRGGNQLDPRMLVDARAIRSGVSQLWMLDNAGAIDRHRGLAFDRVRLRCTLSAGTNELTDRSIGITIRDRIDLIGIAGDPALRASITIDTAKQTVVDGNAAIGNLARYEIDRVPALQALGLPPRGANDDHAHRRYGFRVLERDGNKVRRIGWRFELRLFFYTRRFAGAVFPRLVPSWTQVATNTITNDGRAFFAEEQRVDDVRFDPRRRALRTSVTVELTGDTAAIQEELEEKLSEHIIKELNAAIGNVQTGLKRVRDGRPISLLPQIALPGRVRWRTAGFLLDEAPGRRFTAAGSSLSGALLSVEPCPARDVWASNPAPLEVLCRATLQNLLTEDRRMPQFDARIVAPHRSSVEAIDALQPLVSVDTSNARRGTVFGLKLLNWIDPPPPPDPITPQKLARQRRVLIGALELTLGKEFNPEDGFETIGEIALLPLADDAAGQPHPNQLRGAVAATIVLAVDRVDPGGQDESERDVLVSARQRKGRDLALGAPDRFAPLLLPLREPQVASDKTALKLTAEEVVTRDRDHTLGLSLRAVKDATRVSTTGRVLIIDPRPFRIASVDYQAITAAASSESNEVAVWNAEGEGGLSWRVRDEGQSVAVELPPQVIGEALEKNRSDHAGMPRDVQPGKPAAARFGSTTRMRIDPTFADTRFREPGWNLRRILGNALQRLPGARMLDLRLELLYGLLTRVRSEGLFVTELAGAIGEPALPLLDSLEQAASHLERHKNIIEDVLEAERFRLAIDKPYRVRPDEYLRLEEGASFKLRLRETDESGASRGGPATPLRWPIAGGIPEDTGGLVRREVLERTFSTSDRDQDSFPGGLSWAFESANILMAVYGRPQGDGGSIGGIYLGPQGGYGAQRALFDERKSIVDTETTQGRVQRYRLERVGRIGCLWHAAKHVIVYERTVVPSAQFYNDPPIGLRQDEHAGRAITRKVEEYVEIVKPKRHYPEDGTSVRASGCLVAAEFKSTKIRVDTSWGSDVRREGWQVPLWNSDFEGLPPDPVDPDAPANLYPKPQIELTFAGREGPVTTEIDEPQKLVFYTSVVRGEDDRTDLWKPVRDVDFCDVPKVSAGRVQTSSADLTDAVLPPEPEHVPGYEKFTIGLVASKKAVALAHGRVEDGPVAALRNVTIARAVPLTTGPQGAAVPEFGRAVAAKAANVRAELDRQVGRVIGALDQLDRVSDPIALQNQANALITEALGKLDVKIAEINDTVRDVQNLSIVPDCKALGERARAEINGQLARFMTIANEFLKATVNEIDDRVDAAGGVIESDIQRLDAFIAEAQELAATIKFVAEATEPVLDEENRRLLQEARRFKNDVDTRLTDFEETAKDRMAERIDRANADLDRIIAEQRADLDAIRKRTRASLAVARQLVGASVKSELDALVTPVANLEATLADFIARLVAAGNTVDVASRNAANAALPQIADARKKLQPVLERAAAESSKIPGGVLQLLERIDAGLRKAEQLAKQIAAAEVGTTLAEPLREAARALHGAVVLVKAELTELNTNIVGNIADVLTTIENELNGALEAALGVADKLLDETRNGFDQIKDALDAMKLELDVAIGDVVKSVRDALATIVIPNPGPVQIPADLDDQVAAFAVTVFNATDLMRTTLDAAQRQVTVFREAFKAVIEVQATALRVELEKIAATINKHADTVVSTITAKCEKLVGDASKLFADAKNEIDRRMREALDLEFYRGELERQLRQAVTDATHTIAGIKAAVAAEAARVTRAVEERVRAVSGAVQQTVRDVVGTDLADLARRADGIYQKGDNALRLIRAVGDPPKSDSLGFNRPEVAYVFGEAKELGIDMTPALALVNRASDQVAAVDRAGRAVGELLDSFGVRLPVNQIADQLIPEKLKNLSVSDLLPDMGGIDFKGLLQRVGFPDLDDSDAMKVRHGFDKATRRVWMEADINVPFGESVPLLSFGPVQLLIDTAKFESHARLSAGGGGGIERKMNGRIFGDWRVVCAGQSILTFRQSELRFNDSGQIDFQIQPERVEIAEALRFITDVMRATGQKGGLRVEPFMRGGVPSGVAATLDMVLPPIQTGAFGVSDLSLHILFGVSAIPQFEIVSELAVGSRMMPFSLSVWILNGGGYLIQQLRYAPAVKPRPLLTYTLDIAIVAGLGIGFSAGLVSGGVYVQVGCGIALTWTTGAGGNTTTMRVFLLARGNVDVAGIVTASIALLFEVSYDGERMIGAGTLTIRIKISEFFKLSVDEHVEYVFAGPKKQQQVSEDSSAAFC
ncbi:MAG TPA: hypothetical protein VF618_12330 [Thermoanaerobaculia bacterium]